MANPKRPPLFSTTYPVDDDHVFISIVIGEKQMGMSRITLGGKVVGEGDIDQLDLGAGDKLAGKKIEIKTVVTDVNDITNRTSMTIDLSGGDHPASHTLSVEVDENGDSAIYRCVVEFE